MKRKFKAIPTKYNGASFRSRLEAKWAAFFDLLGWKWVYEPFDLDGYIPDFVLQFYRPLLVEIKPGFTSTDLIADAADKIDRSGWEGEALILGATPVLEKSEQWSHSGPSVFGALREVVYREDMPYSSDEEFQKVKKDNGFGWWDEAIPFHCGCAAAGVGVHHTLGNFGCRVCKDHQGGSPEHDLPVSLEKLWRQAGGATQWKR